MNKNRSIVVSDQQIALIERIEKVKDNIKIIQLAMRELMHEGEHYGTIPGTDKKTLLKPGAEKLQFIFRQASKFDIIERDLGNGHREYRIICNIYSIETGEFLGSGVGSCSTLESKYRYRNDWSESPTGKSVPREYWDIKKTNLAEAQRLIGGKGFKAKKDEDGAWMIFKSESTGKVENPDIADCYNTILKMAKKRAQVDATISVTAASDIFFQDTEDFTHEDFESDGNGFVNKKEKSSSLPQLLNSQMDEFAIKWKDGIESGRLTAKGIIKKLETKYYVTEPQKDAIKRLEGEK